MGRCWGPGEQGVVQLTLDREFLGHNSSKSKLNMRLSRSLYPSAAPQETLTHKVTLEEISSVVPAQLQKSNRNWSQLPTNLQPQS